MPQLGLARGPRHRQSRLYLSHVRDTPMGPAAAQEQGKKEGPQMIAVSVAFMELLIIATGGAIVAWAVFEALVKRNG